MIAFATVLILYTAVVAWWAFFVIPRAEKRRLQEYCRMTCSRGSEGGTCPCSRPSECLYPTLTSPSAPKRLPVYKDSL